MKKHLLAPLVALALAGCSSQADEAAETTPTSESVSPSASQESSPAEGEASESAAANPQPETGVIGIEYTAMDTDGKPEFTYTITSIAVDGKCAEGSSPTPSNGHFVMLEVTATNLRADGGRLSQYQVTPAVYSSDGLMENDSWTFPAIMCAGDEGFPAEGVPTGKSIQFLEVADTQFTSGVLDFAGREFTF